MRKATGKKKLRVHQRLLTASFDFPKKDTERPPEDEKKKKSPYYYYDLILWLCARWRGL